MRRPDCKSSVGRMLFVVLAVVAIGCGGGPAGPEGAVEQAAAPPPPLPEPELESDGAVLSSLTAELPLTIGVLEFADLGPSVEHAVLREAVAEMLISDLASFGDLRVVERRRTADLLEEANLKTTGIVGGATTEANESETAADLLLSGGLGVDGEQVRLQATLMQPGEAEPVFEFELTAGLDRFLDLEQSLRDHVVRALGINLQPATVARAGGGANARRTAVLYFRNLTTSTELATLELGLPEILQAGLGVVEGIDLVEREQLATVLAEQELTAEGLAHPAIQLRVGKLLDAERLIVGSFAAAGDDLRIETRLIDMATSAILSARSARGPRRAFGELTDRLTLDLVHDLSVEAPVDLAQRIRVVAPARQIEAVEHMRLAEAQFREGQYQSAADSYQRVLLLDDGNLSAHVGRVRSYSAISRNEDVIRAANQGLSRTFGPEAMSFKRTLLVNLSNAYYSTRQFDRGTELVRTILAEFPDARTQSFGRAQLAFARMLSGNTDAFIESMEGALEVTAEDPDSAAYGQVLRELYHACGKYMQTPPSRRTPQYYTNSRNIAERADDILLKILALAEGKETPQWGEFGKKLAGSGPYLVGYFDVNQRSVRELLSEEEYVQRLHKFLEVFAWVPEVRFEGSFRLAIKMKEMGQKAAAAEAFARTRERLPEDYVEWLPWRHGVSPTKYFHDPYDFAMSASAQRNQLQEELGVSRSDVAAGYEEHFLQYGLCNAAGPATLVGYHRLGEEPALPRPAALVFGGGTTAGRSWGKVLEPAGYLVHDVRQIDVTLGHLAAYDLVVLARQSHMTYTLREMLALRSYVATGGALIVIVSPGWYTGGPAIHNPLLHFFDVQTGEHLSTWTECEPADDHPVTRKEKSIRAKHGCELECGEAWQTLAATPAGKAVLATRDFGKGRVVVAAMAQWYVPETLWLGMELPVYRAPGAVPHERNSWPLELGRRAHVDLLKRVVKWAAGRTLDDEDAEMRGAVRAASLMALKAHYNVIDHHAMTPAMDALVEKAADDFWREEALWIAGEAAVPYVFDNSGVGTATSMERKSRVPRWTLGTEMPDAATYTAGWRYRPADAERYERLIREFVQSEMAPYARLQLADCRRRRYLTSDWRKHRTAVTRALPAFEELQFDEGSYAWAWHRIALGQLQWMATDYGAAAESVFPVSETFLPGPEKVLALSLLVDCYAKTNDTQRARLGCEAIERLPIMFWPDPELTESYGPHELWELSKSSSHAHAAAVLREMGSGRRRNSAGG